MEYNYYDSLNEGKLYDFNDNNEIMRFGRRLFMGLGVSPRQDAVTTLKKHEYPGYLKFCQTRKYISDLNYLYADCNQTIRFFQVTGEKIKLIETNGTTGNDHADNYFTKNYLNKGVTSKDTELTVKWFKDVIRPAISQRKKEIKESLKEDYDMSNEFNGLSFLESDDLLLEYSGKPENNKAFSEVLADLEKVSKYYVDMVKVCSGMVDYICNISKLNSLKTPTAMNDFLFDCYKKGSAANDDMNKIFRTKGFEHDEVIKRYKSLIRKFSVKYSDVTLAEKKKYAKILEKYYNEISDMWNKYDKDWADKVNVANERLKKIDIDKSGKIMELANSWLNAFAVYGNQYARNIGTFITWLNPEIEITFRYQIIQKLLKK